MLKGLRLKFLFFMMTIVTAMLVIIFGLVIHFTQESMELECLQMMQSVATIPNSPDGAAPSEDIPAPHSFPSHQINIPYISVEVGKDREILAVIGKDYELSDTHLLEQLTRQALSTGKESGELPDYPLRYLIAPSPFGEKVIFADICGEVAAINVLYRNCLFIGLLSFFALFVAGVYLSRWAIRPVEQAWEQQRQFVADASHELKTPLTVISTNAELLQNSTSPQQMQQCSGHILTMSRQMSGLVQSLLELARVDDGSRKDAMTPLDLSRLVNRAALPFDAVFFEKELYLECSIQEGLQVQGNEQYLRQVVEILLDNARKYSHPRTTVLLQLKRNCCCSCLFSLTNSGPAISREDLRNIFKRFYRADKTRTTEHSYGLGLSIAQQIVKEHRGKIWAESSGGKNTFFVQLPTI